MNTILHTSLFASSMPSTLAVGFHNVGGEGVLRASNEAMIDYVQHYYGERCGHLPLSAPHAQVLVDLPTPEIQAQMRYLSTLFGKEVVPTTLEKLKQARETAPAVLPLVVPYINVPEVETRMHNELGAAVWGLPGKMTHVLKNKASFYHMLDEFGLEGFYAPDYVVADISAVATESARFLRHIEDIYTQAGLAQVYPLGVMLRAAEEDGNYGCCLLYEEAGHIVVVQDGDADHMQHYSQWQEALTVSQAHLAATMNVQKEARVVISRYLDLADSPGISVVIMADRVASLGWNGQLQKPGSKACIGTSTYIPQNAYVQRMQQVYEEQTAAFFEVLLRRTAQQCGIDFASITGVANLDIMIPSELERSLRRHRKQAEGMYLAECNPRWTNYTDAIMTVLGANHKEQTIYNMRAAIAAGICTIDKHPLPANVNPQGLRTRIVARDAILQREGTRIICRMTKNPMGLIFAGNLTKAQQEVDAMITQAHARSV